ncbi:hypothetical protein HanLR1_Chr01g0031241 [Helianthus annuus]|nr:hypothetical protein HanLR1_Chr01g0031241 [Helianthus annuus]
MSSIVVISFQPLTSSIAFKRHTPAASNAIKKSFNIHKKPVTKSLQPSYHTNPKPVLNNITTCFKTTETHHIRCLRLNRFSFIKTESNTFKTHLATAGNSDSNQLLRGQPLTG